MKKLLITFGAFLFLIINPAYSISGNTDPLKSWNDGESKKAIIQFVEDVTNEKSKNYVPANERIAVFDNDGTLWAEQPLYFQLVFALDRIKDLADKNPEWKEKQPFKAVLEGDMKTILAGGKKSLLELVMASHTGNTTEEFEEIVREWTKKAKHPETGKLYTDMIYKPMLELLNYLRSNGFKTFITSGGGVEFMRVFSEEVYGIPPEQVIGSSIKTKFEIREGNPVIVRLPELNFIDDKEGKPVAINQHIGRRPIAAFGNSDGDLQMLQWTCNREGEQLCVFIHHTDDKREWAYDRKSHIGKFDKGLDEAKSKGWTVVNMKKEWSDIFVYEKKEK